MTLTLAHSPDSDDAFMFHALATGAVPGALAYRHVLSDIETLNREAEKETYDVTAVSFHGYAAIAGKYALLTTGASFGDGYGPAIVARKKGDLRGKRIAVPGLRTTAYLAARLWLPEFEAVVTPFDKVVDRVMEGAADAALVIHEGQLTYAEKGLDLVVDLGAWWKEKTGLPLPLGGNAVRRSLGRETLARIAHDLRASIEHGLARRGAALDHALTYARGLAREKADRFVSMYVNRWTVDFGPVGKEAIRRLLADGARAGVFFVPLISASSSPTEGRLEVELTLMIDRKVLKHYKFDKEEVVIGRDKACDVVIENVGISRKHTQLFRSGGVWILIDLSENGTYVRGARIAQYNLNDGDEFWMGKFSCLFREPQQSEGVRPAKATDHNNIEGTILVDQRAMEKIAKERSSALAGYITFPRPDGKIETMTVMKTATWMGTEKTCDFRGAGFGVLPRHVLLLRDTTSFIIYNLGKWKPAKVNRQAFTDHVLKEGDVISWMGRDFTFHVGAPKF